MLKERWAKPKMLIIGTAGHIDHGKTTVVKVLTGVDTDRLKEEKERGITIELGFAPFSLRGGRQASIIDAPGHEKFVRHMIAGAGGLDLAMLVVAADEGVMPQTKEHLDILELIGVKKGFIVLTKCDIASKDDIALAIEDIRANTRGTFLEGSPIIHFSLSDVHSYEKFKEIVIETILGLFPEPPNRPKDRPFRMWIDRVFVMKGFGTVVTGTVTMGCCYVGDEIEILPKKQRCRVRGIQTHGVDIETAEPGMRAAFLIQGISHQEVERGYAIAKPEMISTSSTFDAYFRLLEKVDKPIRKRVEVIVHIGTTHCLGSLFLLDREVLEPGEAGICQLRLAQEIPVVASDRFIVRGFKALKGYGTTLGGGICLLPQRKPYKTKEISKVFPWLMEIQDGGKDRRLVAVITLSGYASKKDLLVRTDLGEKDLDMSLQILSRKGEVLQFEKDGIQFVSKSTVVRVGDDLLSILKKMHEMKPEKEGFSLQEIGGQFSYDVEQQLIQLAVNLLVRDGKIETCNDGIRLKGYLSSLNKIDEGFLSKVQSVFDQSGLQPPDIEELENRLSVSSKDIRLAIERLIRDGKLIRAPKQIIFSAKNVEELQRRLVDFLQREGKITTGKFKEIAGVSRKYAIPLAEYFDSIHLTIRISDTERKLR